MQQGSTTADKIGIPELYWYLLQISEVVGLSQKVIYASRINFGVTLASGNVKLYKIFVSQIIFKSHEFTRINPLYFGCVCVKLLL